MTGEAKSKDRRGTRMRAGRHGLSHPRDSRCQRGRRPCQAYYYSFQLLHHQKTQRATALTLLNHDRAHHALHPTYIWLFGYLVFTWEGRGTVEACRSLLY